MESSIFAEGFFTLKSFEMKFKMTIVIVGKNHLQLLLIPLEIE